MESNPLPPNPAAHRFYFFGRGSQFFGIVAVNLILTIITLGLYYPWAKAAYRRYIWNETEFRSSRFVFHGTGREMFKGFLIAYIILIALYLSLALAGEYDNMWILILLFYGLLLLLIPFALYGAWRYRISRTSWRGIYFYFTGSFGEFLKLFMQEVFLTIITFGIYGAWMRVNLQKYLFEHTHIGHIRFNFLGSGGTLFGINLLGALLFYPSLFLYVPIWIKDRFNFTINHTTMSDGENKGLLQSTLKGGEAWSVLVGNFFMLVFTLGLAFPWTYMRKLNMYFDNVIIPDGFDFDNLAQSDAEFRDATGDEMLDILDMGIDF